MPLTLIEGQYRVVGASPDGDSIRFYPIDPDAWVRSGIAARTNAQGGAQLRLDAIDTLETHYTPPSSPHPWHQPTGLGDGAAAALLELLGFSGVERDDRGVVTAATPASTEGYILSRFADKYGRAVAMAFPGARPGGATDGATVFLDTDELQRSVNWQLIVDGWAYPTFYSQLYVDLRRALADAAVAARAAQAHVWAVDATLSGFTLTSRQQLSDTVVILPKLFRRIAEYLSLDQPDQVNLDGFSTFLQQRADPLFTVPEGKATHLDTLVEVSGQTIKMSIPPEQIVFLEGESVPSRVYPS